MSRGDPLAAAAEVKHTAALLRDARSILRRIDALAAGSDAVEEPASSLVAEARRTVERLIEQLVRQEQAQRRRARRAVRRVR